MEKIKVRCSECGKRWSVPPKAMPQCGKCGSVDVEVVIPAMPTRAEVEQVTAAQIAKAVADGR